MKRALLSSAFGMVAGMAMTANVSAYQIEAGGVYIDYDDLDDSALGLSGTYYFAPVDDSGIPRAEADFLRRASSVTAAYLTLDDADADVLAAGVEAYMESFYFSANFSRADFGSNNENGFGAELGFLPAEGVRLSVSYTGEDYVDYLDPSLALGVSSIGLKGKMVRPLNGSQAFNIEGGIAQIDDFDDTIVYQLGGDFYVNHDLSFGLRYTDSDQSNSNEDITLRARMFFIPTVSARIEYSMQDFNDRILLGISGRF